MSRGEVDVITTPFCSSTFLSQFPFSCPDSSNDVPRRLFTLCARKLRLISAPFIADIHSFVHSITCFGNDFSSGSKDETL
mmetsp:Transcript_16905/g.30686  ORF Transcript_16905/g.30686 Transcript_16905/m.30686 type:complete len:80 (-) Transcript_16905:350-589(-)